MGRLFLNLRNAVLSSGGLLAIAFGALLTLSVNWIVYNTTSLLYDVISILILAALASSLAIIVSRIMFGKEVERLTSIIETGGNLDDAVRKSVLYFWRRRQAVFTALTFVFLISVLSGVVGISNLMINYLNLDNLRSQNALLDTQNSMVEAQNEAILIDAMGRIEERLQSAETRLANLERIRDAWASLNFPPNPKRGIRSEVDAYLCSENTELFECLGENGASLRDMDADAQKVSNAVAKAMVWFDLERQSGQNSMDWGVYNEADHGQRLNWISEIRVIEPVIFFKGLTEVCGVSAGIGSFAPHLLATVDGIQQAYYKASTSSVHGANFAYGARSDLGEVTVDLHKAFDALRTLQIIDSSITLEVSFEVPDNGDKAPSSEINRALLQSVLYLVSAERSLRGLYNQCGNEEDKTRVMVTELKAKLEGLNQRRSSLNAARTASAPQELPLVVDKN